MTALYWRSRWFLWDLRDRVLVRAIARKMWRTDVLYVHPEEGGPALWVIHHVDVTDPHGTEPHDHIEGFRKRA